MMNEIEIKAYLEKHKLSEAACEYINSVRKSESARMVGVHAKNNVCTWYPSIKMGRAIQAESRTAEYGYVMEFEYNDDVLEYWDQPAPVYVTRTYKNGSKRKGSYTPDYLVLSKNGPVVIEVKQEKSIKTLIVKNPSDWVEVSNED